ncbi:cytochrome P450 (plasmid) [Streptosporangium sp. CA-135522]|uniref:cytochrome P450 n=1 Tax=Streptosporangium sp. CA-135522 TaxID=3240072 RepID=UPI003D945426
MSPIYAELRRAGPISRVSTPAGAPAWLVTAHAEARSLSGDPRLRRSRPESEKAARISGTALNGSHVGDHKTEEAFHARMRRLLVPAFAAKRMLALSERIEELVVERLDAMAEAYDQSPDGVVDLHRHLAAPLPIAVICELFGVSEEEYFRGLSARMGASATGGDAQQTWAEFAAYMLRQVAAKQDDPAEDILSDLARAKAAESDFTEEELIIIAVGILFAGRESTAGFIDFGALWLLSDPRRLDAVVADPGRVEGTVEEILRLSAPSNFGLRRYAHEDVEIGGVTIARGDAVMISSAAANRDPNVFPDPDRFDPSRSPNPHLTFAHGAHFCIGASLARIELRAAFTGLLARFPGIRLAVGLDEIKPRTDAFGVTGVPVTW